MMKTVLLLFCQGELYLKYKKTLAFLSNLSIDPLASAKQVGVH